VRIERRTLVVPVDDLLPAEAASLELVGDLVLPAGEAKGLLCCLPGGGMTRRYWDLGLSGFASHAAAKGWAVLATDHPGAGDQRPTHDVWLLPDHLARCAERAAEVAHRAVGVRDLHCVGVGHSLGAMVTLLAQANGNRHKAIVLCGFTAAGLRWACSEAELAAAERGLDEEVLLRLAAARFGRPFPELRGTGPTGEGFVGRDPDPGALVDLWTCTTNLIAAPALLSFLPGNVVAAAGKITVPVLVARGEDDPLVPAALNLAAEYPASRSVRMATIAGAGHNDVVARSRRGWWDHMLGWAGDVVDSLREEQLWSVRGSWR
jgi:pimeloyl-ACP methyl ester carboxylesterase